MYNITLFEGDGIGPEITNAVKKILEATGIKINWIPQLLGQKAFEVHNDVLPKEALESIEKTKIALKAPVTTPIGKGFRSVNVALRKHFDLYTNLRPTKSLPNTLSRYDDVDLVIVRENTEGLYIGIEKMHDDNNGADSIKRITRKATERIVRYAFEYARANNRKLVTCAHKANILKLSDGLFLDIFNEIKLEYPDIESNDRIIDNMCMQLVMYPNMYDVIVTSNLYGDILSDLVAGLTGGLGLLPGANIGSEYAVFEAVHGSAPDIAGKNIANPIALLLSSCMMLDHLKEFEVSNRIKKAVYKTLDEKKVLTRDLGGTSSTDEITNEIIKNL